jgi:hypothetical protein
MAAAGLLAAGGLDAVLIAGGGAMAGCIGTLGVAMKTKPLNDWIDAKDLNAIIVEQQERAKQQRVLGPGAAEAFANSVGYGIKDDVKIMKPLKFKSRGKSRRRAGFGTAFQ